jgi:hypothetical protein
MNMKRIAFSLIFSLSFHFIFSQSLNVIVKDPDLKNKEVMVGKCNRDGLKQGEFGAYFKSQYEVYEPAQKYIDKMKTKINLVDITVVFGTWCSDSKLQVPRFYKILDQSGYNEKRMTVIGVNRKKKAFTTNIEHLKIERVPTFIVSQNGKELGRIIESPKKTLEKDLARIIKKARL